MEVYFLLTNLEQFQGMEVWNHLPTKTSYSDSV